MSSTSSTIADRREAVSPYRAGLILGAIGVVAFSLSFPMTRLAVASIDPVLVGLGRAVVAGLLAALWLAISRTPRPAAALWPRLALVSVGVVFGFPLFTSLALHRVPSSHVAIISGLLPISTAIMAVLRANERPAAAFWAASVAGVAAVLAFAAVQGAGWPSAADAMVFTAVIFGGLGYAEGGALSRQLGGPAVICWALVLSLPALVPIAAWRLIETGWPHAGASAWAGFAYVAAISMFLGFFAWYRGLALGGIARVGQLQLAQPVLTLLWSALLLGESLDLATIAAATVVLATVVLTQLARSPRPT